MTKSSMVNVPDASPRPASSAAGAFRVSGDVVVVQTEERVELTDVTDRVRGLVRDSGIREGIVSLWSMHTTFAVFMNESQKALHADIKRLLGSEGNFGEQLGLSKDWAYKIVKLVGNYGEVFDRNVGAGSPLKIDRGLNKLWTKGGLQYAPPVR